MASSDDDEPVLQSVTNYHFVDKDGVPISFSVLPIMLSDAEKAEVPSQLVTVRGTSDGGLHSVFKDVIAWKLILDGDGPEVSVLSKDNKWIMLEKPKKSYEECIRTTLFTLHLLHFSKKNPEASMKSFWEHLHRSLSFFDDGHCQDDFKDHIELIKIFLERDESLAKSQILLTFVKNPEKAFVEDFDDALEERPFIVDDELEDCIGIDDGNESEEETDLFDSVCAICDNGGELLCCEGRCMRSFHATKRAGEDSDCASLGLTRIQVEAMQNFLCKNCQLKQHQCFSCGKLGSSDKSANAEVFSCVSATCGHFYHPKCVAELLFPDSKAEATELEKRIAAGESFTCPVHRCIVCKLVENKGVEELQFAICRRCPKAYHRKCLPRDISFDDIEEENIIQRAWDGLLPNRILIYCLKHDIDEELGTPYRDHITFPKLPEKKKEMAVQKMIPKKYAQVSDEIFQDRNFVKPAKRPEKLSKTDGSLLKGEKIAQKGLDSQQKWRTLKKDVKLAVEPTKFSKSGLTKIERSNLNSEKALMDKAKVPDAAVTVHGKLINSAPKIISEMRKDVIALVEEESSSLTHDDIRKSLSTPSCYVNSSGHIDKTITLGRIEGAIEAVRTALDKLEGGGKVEDAKAVCEPEILKQLIRWNTKLKVYLAPVLHGARYSSYGRHFTKLDKLHEITDKLQWYVQDGDMIVDFCCGANEFSLLMKEKLDAAGRKCSFKNYDILQAKNDFNFEMRDWMSVRPKELPNGSKLIMGLNPPFGLHSRLANQFIDKALTFRPKLIILIVPEETRRLDTKNPQYDLIWEDYQSLSGKSFYLPGSIDVYDKQIEQWNVKPPVLYLWSRPDWTAKHRSIASSQGHKSRMQPALIHKESQAKSEEDTLSNKNAKEKCMEKDATLGKRENMPIKQKGIAIPHDHTYLEPAFPDAQIKLERRDSPLNESQIKERQQGKITIAEHREDDRKQIQESHENREAAPVQKESNSIVHDKKHHIEEMTGNKNTILPGDREIRSEANKKNAEQNKNKKRKSTEMHKDKHIKMKKLKQQQQQQRQEQRQQLHQEPQPVGASVRTERDELPDMSMSPPDTGEHKRHSTSMTPTSGAFEAPFDNDEISHRGYTGSVEDMRTMSSIGRPSSFRDGMDNLPRVYNPAERDSFYMNTHSRSGTTVYGGDYAIPKSDERYQGYSSTDAFNQKQYGKNEHGRPSDEDLRMLKNYGMQGEEITTGYGRSFNTDLRVQRRTYDMLGEEVTAVHGRPSSADIRTQIKSYGMAGEEDHPQGNRFSLGGSGSASGNSSVYPSSSFRFSSPSAETSAMQRYAPHLDETNYSRMSPGIPLQGRDSYSRMSPGIPLQGRDKYSDMHGMRRDIPTDSLGYALGSPPFSNQGPYGPGWVHK